MLEASSCRVRWTVTDKSYPQQFISVPEITNGTFVGLLHGERTFQGQPEFTDPYPYDPDRDPPTVRQPYLPPYVLSYRFRQPILTVSIRTPWDASDSELAGLAPFPNQFMPFFRPFLGVCTPVGVVGGNGSWTVAGLLPNVMVLAEPGMRITSQPDKTLSERCFGTNRGGASRAPIGMSTTISSSEPGFPPEEVAIVGSGSQIRSTTEPKVFYFNDPTNSGSFLVKEVLDNTGSLYRAKIFAKRSEAHYANLVGQTYHDWWTKNGGVFQFPWAYQIVKNPDYPKLAAAVGQSITIEITGSAE